MSATNGKHHTVSELREQIELAQLRNELRRLQLVEAGAELFNPATRWMDAEGWGWHGYYSHTDRDRHKDGQNAPHVYSEADLDRYRGFAQDLAATNHIAVGIVEHIRNYAIRTGFKYEAVPEKRFEQDVTAKELAPQVQEVIDEFGDLNAWSQREREICERYVVDGEAMVRAFNQRDHTTLVRFIEAEQLRQPLGSPQTWSFGIETDPRDIEDVKNYAVCYEPEHPDDYECVPADEVTHLKANVRSCTKRGMSDFFCTREAVDGVQKMLRNMAVTGGIQSAIAWIEEYTGTSREAVQGNVAETRDTGRTLITDPITGKVRNWKAFDPGSIPKIGSNKKYQPGPLAANTTQHISIVQACLRAVGNRWGMPEYLVSGDASNANYASTLVSGAPFVTAVECRQSTFARYFLRVVWIAVGNAADAGRFYVGSRRITRDEVMHYIDIHATPPQVPISDKVAESQVDSADIQAGVMSVQERQRRRGLDPDLMAREIKERPPQGGQDQGSEGGDGQGGDESEPPAARP
jgi:hypothetical protein